MLYPQHRAEWLDSCVSPELIDLNVWTIEDAAEADELLNKNTDRRWRHSAIVPGWAVAGISLKTGDRTFEGAQFKPDSPVVVGERVLKYLSAAGEDSAPLFLDTPNPRYWADIAADVTRQIVLTEGAKKAGASMTVGEATISIPGVYAGQKKGRLKPQLKPFATLGRRWIVGFDSDWKTNRNVFHALDRMARLLATTGGVVLFLDLPNEAKGIDDYIALHGAAAYQGRLDSALTYEEWRELCKGIWESQQSRQLTAVPDDDDAEAREEENRAIAHEVKRLALSVNESFTLGQLLPLALAQPLEKVAERLGVPAAAFLAVLLPICAGRIRVGCELEIDPSTDYTVAPLLWACLLGESGSAKSVMLNMVFKPLLRLQRESDKVYRQQKATYDAEMREWVAAKGDKSGLPMPEEPMAREHYVDDATMETLADILSGQPAFALPLVMDELAGLLNGLNQYKSGGKGSDRQRLLTLANGGPIKKNRKGARISQDRTALSITGTTQPHVLLGLMRGLTEADDGLWARFFWSVLPPSEMPAPGNGGRLDLSPMLEALYRKLEEQTPFTFKLSSSAAEAWRLWHLYTEKARLMEQHPTIRAIYPKARERAARVALVVHFVEYAIEGRTPADTVSGQTMENAIAFVKWTIGQALLVYADAGISDYGSSSKLAKFVKAHQGMTLTSREAQKFFGSRVNAKEVKKIMEEIESIGHGRVFREGRSIKIEVFPLFIGGEDSEDTSTQSQTEPDSQLSSEQRKPVRTVRTVQPHGDVTGQSPERPKTVEPPKPAQTAKSEDTSPKVLTTVLTTEDSQNLDTAGDTGLVSSLSSLPKENRKKGEENREIKPGDRFVLGGNATAYPRVFAMTAEIFTCTSDTITQITGSSDSFKDQNFPRSWCWWYPPAAVTAV